MVDGASFWTCCRWCIRLAVLNYEVWHCPDGDKLVICTMWPDQERQHLLSV
jgi:hypothetical protein